jgi:galactokinase
LSRPDPALEAVLRRTYGDDPAEIARRTALLQKVLERFLERFGDVPVRVFRSPGRINLRGMHVDTHGGYLNLMTHQREMVLAAAATDDPVCRFSNIDPEFDEASFPLDDLSKQLAASGSWMEFIGHPAVTGAVQRTKGRWENYLKGAMLRAAHALPGTPLRGLRGVVGSDIPRGAALSSSHALCVVTLLGALAHHGGAMSHEALVLAVRDAEWFTGARTGTSDQAAEILGGRNEVVNVALLAEDFDASGAQRLPLPDALDILVVNSHTKRNLSGEQLAAYTRNRFAYSMAMEIVRQELRGMGWEPSAAARIDRLSRLTPETLGGLAQLYALLIRIPQEMTLAEMRQRYELPGFDQAYDRYFGNVPESQRPARIGLRGPLVFGIAESERARHFLPALAQGDYARAGALMTAGHDGDRVVDQAGHRFVRRLSDEILQRLADEHTPIEMVPGDYGASSPVLDGLVDTALQAGALGASLTGAGLAGAVLVLCRREDTPAISAALRNWLTGPPYAALAQRSTELSGPNIEDAVMVNRAPAGAGEIRIE